MERDLTQGKIEKSFARFKKRRFIGKIQRGFRGLEFSRKDDRRRGQEISDNSRKFNITKNGRSLRLSVFEAINRKSAK